MKTFLLKRRFFVVFSLILYLKMEKIRAIVLSLVPYGNDRMMVKMFTRERGTLTFSVYGVHGRRSKKMASLMQLNILDVEFEYHVNRDVQQIHTMQVWHPYHSILYEPQKSVVAMFLGEFLMRALKNEKEGGALYDYLESAFVALDEAADGYENFHISLMLNVAMFMGYGMENVKEEDVSKLKNGRERREKVETILTHFRDSLPEFSGDLNSLYVLRDIL